MSNFDNAKVLVNKLWHSMLMTHTSLKMVKGTSTATNNKLISNKLAATHSKMVNNTLKASEELLSQVENEKTQQNENKKLRAQEKKEGKKRMKATAEQEKVKDVIVVSHANMEIEADWPDPKINEYTGDINSAVFAMSLNEIVELREELPHLLQAPQHEVRR